MNPGTPVSTTLSNRIFVATPSRISRMASSGMVESSNFSRMRLGVTDVVRRAMPRCIAPGEYDLGRGLAEPLRDGGDHRITSNRGMPFAFHRLPYSRTNSVTTDIRAAMLSLQAAGSVRWRAPSGAGAGGGAG